MNGAADLGGMMGFGPVIAEADEPAFHAEWESRVFALTLAAGFTGAWNIDASRFARESLPPAEYLSSSYYRIWYRGLVRLLVNAQMVTDGEVETGKQQVQPLAVNNILSAKNVPSTLAKGGPADRPAEGSPAFAVGTTIHTINHHPTGHTRLPRYARGKRGVIAAVHGFHVFPDSRAHGNGDETQFLYKVEFTARDLWGADRLEQDRVSLDLWESYCVNHQ
jgi:nitrile hydratase